MPQPPRWFAPEEIEGLEPRLVELLDKARGLAKVPFRIASGRRSPDENLAAGGVMDSAHTRGLAVDLACFDSRTRMRMLCGLVMGGFTRVGIYHSHLHADVDESLPKDVLWLGGASH